MTNESFISGISQSSSEKITENTFALLKSLFITAGAKIQTEAYLNDSDKFARWILRNYGKIELFLAQRQVDVSELHVELKMTSIIRSRIYKTQKEIAEAIESDDVACLHGSSAMDIITGQKESQSQSYDESDVVVVGGAGSGKTTTLKNMTVQIAKGATIRGAQRIPFYVQLRTLSNEQKIYDHLLSVAKVLFSVDPRKFLDGLLKSGRGVFLLDGFDEVSKTRQSELINEVKKLRMIGIDSATRNLFVLSGRPSMLNMELEGFTKYEVLPFSRQNQIDFIYKWFGKEKATKANQLKTHFLSNKDLPDLASSPLLLSTICALFENEFDIPKGRIELFECCIEGLAGKWDSFRSIKRDSHLNEVGLANRVKALTVIANRTLEKRQIVFGAGEEVVQDAVKFIGNELGIDVGTADELLDCFHSDYSMLVEQSPALYSFSHLQFHEYLCARYIFEAREEIQFLDRMEGDLETWEFPLIFLGRKIMKPYDFLAKLWAKIDKKSFRQVNIFANIIKEKPSIGGDRLYDIISSDIANIGNRLRALSGFVEVDNGRICLRDYKGQDSDMQALFGLIELRNQINARPEYFVVQDGFPKLITRILVTKGNSNQIYKVRNGLFLS